MVNQNPEQLARDEIDASLAQAGWVVQDAKKIDFSASLGVAIREYRTDIGPADYALFVAKTEKLRNTPTGVGRTSLGTIGGTAR